MTKEHYKLPTHLRNKLKRVNKHLNKFGGRSLTEKEAIRWNIDNNSSSGFESGGIAFDISNAPDVYEGISWHRTSARYYHWIGDALIEISEVVTGVPYDSWDIEIQRIIKDTKWE